MTLVLATKNPGKTREFLRLFTELAPDVEWDILRADEVGLKDVEETGTTFAENARQKAREAASQSGILCLGEDSGLEVDWLGGAPGVKSHRFSRTGDDADNNALLLEKLKDVPLDRRTARYRCA
ncbi:MAG TPA: non-canonical purine NTP pyrophosphatase, partial [Firmicutes bacterium]|nr:non-canonical purine NTP pyrophosphatase [Candidatus Fermentithermobacillaceae bacterium]